MAEIIKFPETEQEKLELLKKHDKFLNKQMRDEKRKQEAVINLNSWLEDFYNNSFNKLIEYVSEIIKLDPNYEESNTIESLLEVFESLISNIIYNGSYILGVNEENFFKHFINFYSKKDEKQ